MLLLMFGVYFICNTFYLKEAIHLIKIICVIQKIKQIKSNKALEKFFIFKNLKKKIKIN